MESCSEIRKFAWGQLWRGKWFWRLLATSLLLGFASSQLSSIAARLFHAFGASDWSSYWFTRMLNERGGEQLAKLPQLAEFVGPVPELTTHYICWTTATTVMEQLLAVMFMGIAAYGFAAVTLRCADNDEQRWLGVALGGFKMPLGMFALHFMLAIVWVLWSVIALLPLGAGIVGLLHFGVEPFSVAVVTALGLVIAVLVMCVPFYRYRFVWYLKVDHPEWGAWRCLRASTELMRGRKWRSFQLDCSYWKAVALPLVMMLVFILAMAMIVHVGLIMKVLLVMLGVLAFLSVFASILVVANYVLVGQCRLYRGFCAER